MAFTTLLWLVAILASAVAKKMYIYVGSSTDSGDSFKIYSLCDINLKETLIHKSDFLCIPENNCDLDPKIHNGTYNGLSYRYQVAYLQINLLIMPFVDKMQVRYLIDHDKMQSSVLGFAPKSDFFQYFVIQNYIHDLQISFYFDWENVVYFRSEVFGTARMPVNTTLRANLTFYKQSKVASRNITFCLANLPPQMFEDSVFFRVPKAEYAWWKDFLGKTKKASDENIYGNLKYNISLQLSSSEYANLGTMEYEIDDLVDDRGGLNVQPFGSEYEAGAGCDIVVGSQSLKKFKYKFYYAETMDGLYNFDFDYDGMDGVLTDQQNANSLLWLQMIFFVIVFSFISFLAYEYILKKNEDVGLRDEDLSIPGEEHEEKGYAEPKYNITKEEIALLERRIN